MRVRSADVSAVAGSDYDAVDFTALIAEGASTADVFVSVHGDTAGEDDETLQLLLSDAVGATIAAGSGVGTIVNDDFVITAIHDLQGSGATSPKLGELVATTGIVTALEMPLAPVHPAIPPERLEKPRKYSNRRRRKSIRGAYFGMGRPA